MTEIDNKQIAVDLKNFILKFYDALHSHPLDNIKIKISSHTFHVLYLISHQEDGMMPMAELADKLQIKKQQLSKLISDLEDREYVERRRFKTNRRIVYIAITDTGMSFMEQINEVLTQKILNSLESCSEEELATLSEGMAKMSIFLK